MWALPMFAPDLLGAEKCSSSHAACGTCRPLVGNPTGGGTENTWEDGTARGTCANTRHQEGIINLIERPKLNTCVTSVLAEGIVQGRNDV